MKVKVEELEELTTEREKFYAVKCSEMCDFKTEIQKSVEEISNRINELRYSRDKVSHLLKLNFPILVILLINLKIFTSTSAIYD